MTALPQRALLLFFLGLTPAAVGAATPAIPALRAATCAQEIDAELSHDFAAWPAADLSKQLAYEKELLATISPARLRKWHAALASEPHIAGTPGDMRQINRISRAFEEMGLEVERHEIWVYLPFPVHATLEVVSPERIPLALRERPIAEDAYSGHEDLTLGWNGYSGSGDVTAQVVYANHGTRADFERLKALGVDCSGKIVLARYGGNYRGFKAKFAEAAGAAGLIIFTDPADSGFGRGLMYPDGGWCNPTSIQRGSILTLPYQGCPLTPFVESTKDAERLDPADVDFPSIPVQPVGWIAAQEILVRMQGASVPGGWQGGLPFRYRLTGGEDLQVHLQVSQERRLTRTYNVLGTLRGTVEPEQRVIIGAHHDAWGFGAADPTCGTICVMEAARTLSDLARKGHRPRRSITFATWGAEEHGIIGSVEWVEGRTQDLRANCVAYFNLDAAASGPNFGSSASPALQRLIAGAASQVQAIRDDREDPEHTVLDRWRARGHSAAVPELPLFGDLGGGSDHVGFIALTSIPCASFSASGSPGSAYHSNYDNLSWYRKVAGNHYQPARLVTQVTALAAARLANSPLVQLDPLQYGPETRRHLQALTGPGRAADLFASEGEHGERPIAVELARIEAAALRYEARARPIMQRLKKAVRSGRVAGTVLTEINAEIVRLERAWHYPAGIPGRPWFQSLYAATDESSGYAAWMLPGLRYAVEHRDAETLDAFEPRYVGVFQALGETLEGIAARLPAVEPERR